MLRIHFMQQWYALSDPAMEDALYEIEPMRRFAGLGLKDGTIPDETTILSSGVAGTALLRDGDPDCSERASWGAQAAARGNWGQVNFARLVPSVSHGRTGLGPQRYVHMLR